MKVLLYYSHTLYQAIMIVSNKRTLRWHYLIPILLCSQFAGHFPTMQCRILSNYSLNVYIKINMNEKYILFPSASSVYSSLIGKELVMEGFLVLRWLDRWAEGIQQNIQWIKEGKIKYRETVTIGFENMFKAFTNMLKGENIGKAIVSTSKV